MLIESPFTGNSGVKNKRDNSRSKSFLATEFILPGVAIIFGLQDFQFIESVDGFSIFILSSESPLVPPHFDEY